MIPSVPGALLGAAFQTALITGQRYGVATGGGKNVALRSCAFPSSVVSREPSSLERGGVIADVEVSCLCIAHLVIFHSPFGDDAASVTLSRWACGRRLLISLPF